MVKKKKNNFILFLLQLTLILFITYVLVRYVAAKTTVDGVSMYPTLSDGENVVIDKLSYRTSGLTRFDIIVFEEDDSETGYYIKRVIGLPGDKVTIDKDGTIYINGRVLKDRYGYETIKDPGMAIDTITVGKDEYFVLGDNRNNSTDSRFEEVGNVTADRILGKVRLRIWPLDKFGYIDLYSQRVSEGM